MKIHKIYPIIIIMIFLFSACNLNSKKISSEPTDTLLTENEAVSILPSLLKQAQWVSTVLAGGSYETMTDADGNPAGFTINPQEIVTDGEDGKQYAPWPTDSFRSVAEVRRAFTSLFTDQVVQTQFDARLKDAFKDINGKLFFNMMYADPGVRAVWKIESAKVKSVTGEKIRCEAEYDTMEFQNGDITCVRKNGVLELVQEDGHWVFNETFFPQ